MNKLNTGQPAITGYRNMTEAEIALINRIKEHAETTRQLLGEVSDYLYSQGTTVGGIDPDPARWLAIGRTELQQGYMAVIRAVAQPTTF